MTSEYQGAFVGLAVDVVLFLPVIVVNFQSWIDPF